MANAEPAGRAVPVATLGWRLVANYALPALGPGILYNLIVVMYMKYSTDSLGIAAATVGTIFFASKIWDAVSDPLAGYLSDGTRSRLGRRRSWLLASAVPLAIFSWMVWVPPDGLSGLQMTLWVTVGVFGFYTTYTASDVPHMALGAELTVGTPANRNRVFAWRQVVRTSAMLLAFTVGALVVADPESGRRAAGWFVGLVGVGSILLTIYCVLSLPAERAEYAERGGAENAFKAIRDVVRNRHARLLLAVYFVEAMGTGAIGTLVPYTVAYVMKLPGSYIPAMLGTYVLATFAGIPIWIRMAHRFEKRRLWLFAMVQSGLGFGLLLFVGEGTWGILILASLIAGVGGACGQTLGQALKADIVDLDEYDTGERKEGAYFATWSFTGKLATGVTLGSVGWIIDAVGYVPNVDQSDEVKQTILFLMGGVPLAGYLIGALLFSRFDLSESEHARIRRELDERHFASGD